MVRVLDEKEDVVPINVRTILGVGGKDGLQLEELQYQYYDGKKNDPQYTVA